jgi:hypothetical protein
VAERAAAERAAVAMDWQAAERAASVSGLLVGDSPDRLPEHDPEVDEVRLAVMERPVRTRV